MFFRIRHFGLCIEWFEIASLRSSRNDSVVAGLTKCGKLGAVLRRG